MVTSQCIDAVRTRKKYIDLTCVYTADPEISDLGHSPLPTLRQVLVLLSV